MGVAIICYGNNPRVRRRIKCPCRDCLACGSVHTASLWQVQHGEKGLEGCVNAEAVEDVLIRDKSGLPRRGVRIVHAMHHDVRVFGAAKSEQYPETNGEYLVTHYEGIHELATSSLTGIQQPPTAA